MPAKRRPLQQVLCSRWPMCRGCSSRPSAPPPICACCDVSYCSQSQSWHVVTDSEWPHPYILPIKLIKIRHWYGQIGWIIYYCSACSKNDIRCIFHCESIETLDEISMWRPGGSSRIEVWTPDFWHRAAIRRTGGVRSSAYDLDASSVSCAWCATYLPDLVRCSVTGVPSDHSHII